MIDAALFLVGLVAVTALALWLILAKLTAR